jgi:hypothetical protein
MDTEMHWKINRILTTTMRAEELLKLSPGGQMKLFISIGTVRDDSRADMHGQPAEVWRRIRGILSGDGRIPPITVKFYSGDAYFDSDEPLKVATFRTD